jgi:hypothetical protein
MNQMGLKTDPLVHRIENITSNIGKIEFPFVDMMSYEIMGKNSQENHYFIDNEDGLGLLSLQNV